MPGPLSHIRVLDLSRVLAGPWAGQNLADLGAEVIKVERPRAGDDSRGYGPPWVKDRDGEDTSDSAYFLSCNRGKKSITVNLARAQGQAIVRDLAAKSDVLLENYKFGDLDRYALGYRQLSELNPRLVYCSITGFGHTGPDRERPGYDFMVQGIAGHMSITGEPGGEPMRFGIPIVDIFTGMYAAIAVCAALAQRAESGKGQHLDVALFDSALAMLANQGATFLATGKNPERIGNAHPTIVPYQVFGTRDGAVILACGNDNLFAKFCSLAGCERLARDARFEKNSARVNHRAVLVPQLAEIMRGRTTREWVESLEGAGIPCGPINTIEQALSEPQARSRGARLTLPHPAAGSIDLIASPMRFSETPARQDTPPPTLGQHTDEVLRELLGMSAEQITKLRHDGVL